MRKLELLGAILALAGLFGIAVMLTGEIVKPIAAWTLTGMTVGGLIMMCVEDVIVKLREGRKRRPP